MKKLFSYSIIAVLLVGFAAGCNKTLAPASLTVNVTELEVDSNGGQTTIGVKSNRDWSATVDCDWLTLTPSSAEAFEASSYMIVTAESNESSARTATITVTADDGSISAVVNVIQGRNGFIITSPAEFVDYLKLAEAGTATNDYRLGADIDLTGVTLPAVSAFNYALNGRGYKLTNWTTSAPLFTAITANGSVIDLTIDESCRLTIPADAENFGFITITNTGTIQNVENRAPVTIEGISAGRKGTICGVNQGYINGCSNRGDIIYSGEPHTASGAYYGGVIGQVTGETARIENCTNRGDISFTFSGVLDKSFYVAGVVGAVNSNAKAMNCINVGDVTLRSAGSSTLAMVGGIVTYAGGEVSNCTNNGAISYFAESSDGAADGGVKGTGVAGIAAYEGWSGGTVTGNINNGDITLRAGYSLGFETTGSAEKFATNVAGIFGHMYKCAVDNCTNSGTVSSTLADIYNTAGYFNNNFRQSVGGIVGSSWGEISNCQNSGTINATFQGTKIDKTQVVLQVGGISGGDYHSDQLSSPITNCTNTGAINYVCDAVGSNNALGGIVGWPSKENNSASVLIQGCENAGAITADGSGISRIGGISGGATNQSGNINRGSIYLKGGTTACAVGGVAGLLSGQQSIIGCENYGQIKSDVKLAGARGGANAAIGGICGAVNNQANVAVTGCTVNCEIIAPEGSTAFMLMGVVGQDKSSSSNVATIGTEASPNVISGGTLTLGGTAVQITSENFATYALPWGTEASANANVTSNTIFN